jgi:hypothetical protein
MDPKNITTVRVQGDYRVWMKHPVSFSLPEPLPPIDPFIEKVALLGSKQWVLGADDDIRESGRLPGPRYTCRATIHTNDIYPGRLVR